MKYLKIDDNKGWYTIDAKNWIDIGKINKEDLLKLLDFAINDDKFEMDEYNETNLQNQAHQIIYENIYANITSVLNNRTRFKDESELKYKDAIEKYK